MPLSSLSTIGGLSAIGAINDLGSSGGSSSSASTTPAVPSWVSGTLAQYVAIGLGAILIIAGLFAFKTVRETVIVAGKGAAAAAA